VAARTVSDRPDSTGLNTTPIPTRHGKDGRELRWRIEHAQPLSPADIPRFGRLGVIPSMQAVHRAARLA
jgi:predicted amidohydrolase YtcJ